MCAFNDLIRDIGLVDVELKNRAFTWTKKRPSPSFSKIDRVFVSSHWIVSYKEVTLKALEMVVSDHAPLLLSCTGGTTKSAPTRMENFWLNYEQVRNIIQIIWGQRQHQLDNNLTENFQRKAHKMQVELRWHRGNFGEAEKHWQQAKKIIMFFDQIEEKRNLDEREFKLRQKARERAYELANVIEVRWQQLSRCKWLQSGDKNTRYFHAYASSRLNRNMVHELQHNGTTVTDQAEVERLFVEHMKAVLGQEGSVLDFQATQLYTQRDNMSAIEVPFTDEEISTAIKQLAKNKASEPDGLTHEFLQKTGIYSKVKYATSFRSFIRMNWTSH